ncbi:MAG: 3'(2'),5'-bisphosphate nucleotidase CysQ [Hyphomicrobiales bacterium]
MNLPDFPSLASSLLPAVRAAGAAILGHRGVAAVERKADESPVTAADREAEEILLAALAGTAPAIPVVSEEAGVPAASPGDRFFLVDPLDGTKEFITGEEDFTVNIGLIDNGAPVFGIVYAPAKSTVYFTLQPKEAYRAPLDCGAPDKELSSMLVLPLSGRPRPAGGLVAAVSRSHLDEKTRTWLDGHDIARTMSAGSSLKFCVIAEGNADVYPRFGRTMEWDTAAGHAVLAAAGGSVVDVEGKPLTYGKLSREFDNPGFIAWGPPAGRS